MREKERVLKKQQRSLKHNHSPSLVFFFPLRATTPTTVAATTPVLTMFAASSTNPVEELPHCYTVSRRENGERERKRERQRRVFFRPSFSTCSGSFRPQRARNCLAPASSSSSDLSNTSSPVLKTMCAGIWQEKRRGVARNLKLVFLFSPSLFPPKKMKKKK